MPYYPPATGGNVTGPGSSTSGDIATFNGTTGKVIQDGGKALPSGAVVGDTDAQTLTNKTLTTPKIDSIKDTNGNTIEGFSATTSAVNYVNIRNSAAGLAPVVQVAGSSANIELYLEGKGTSGVALADGSANLILEAIPSTTPVNYLQVSSSNTTVAPSISALGTDTNIDLNLKSKGTGTVKANGLTLVDISSSQTVSNKILDQTNLIGGNSSVASTPASGFGKLYGIGTSNVRPGWINESGTNETIITSPAGALNIGDAWTAPTLLNSWVNYDPTTFEPAGYMKDGMGFVHLRGMVKSGTVAATVFTLPVGYRPAKNLVLLFNAGDALSPGRINSNGNVAQISGANSFLSFDGISFRAEQ